MFEHLFKDRHSGYTALGRDRNCALAKIQYKCYTSNVCIPNPEDIINITPEWAIPEPVNEPVKLPTISFSM
jgi:hypothetical protein